MPVTILAGDEDFELYRKLAKLKDALLDPAWASFNYLKIECPNVTDVLDHALSVPFGPGNKVIVFDKCDFFTRKSSASTRSSKSKDKNEGGSVTAKQLELLEEAMASVHPNTHLIFACPFNFDSNLKLSKAVAKHAQLEEFPKIKYYMGSSNPKLETWVRKEAKARNATIDDAAIAYLLDGTEANLRQIAQEIEKAATFILPKTHISYAAVVELSPHHSHVFSLLDHWLEGRSSEALISINDLMAKQPALKVIATLQTFLSRFIEIKSICDHAQSKLPWAPGVKRRELPFNELVNRVANEMRVKPFLIEKDIRRLRHHSTTYLIDKRNQLTRLEDLVKTGQVKDRNALELFLSS